MHVFMALRTEQHIILLDPYVCLYTYFLHADLAGFIQWRGGGGGGGGEVP